MAKKKDIYENLSDENKEHLAHKLGMYVLKKIRIIAGIVSAIILTLISISGYSIIGDFRGKVNKEAQEIQQNDKLKNLLTEQKELIKSAIAQQELNSTEKEKIVTIVTQQKKLIDENTAQKIFNAKGKNKLNTLESKQQKLFNTEIKKKLLDSQQDQTLEAYRMEITKLVITVTANERYVKENKDFSRKYYDWINDRVSIIESKLGINNNSIKLW